MDAQRFDGPSAVSPGEAGILPGGRARCVSQQIDVTMQHNQEMKTDQFTWTRKGSMGRPLYHLGKREFYPAGAPDVCISFAEEGSAIVMTVNDGDMTLTARRT